MAIADTAGMHCPSLEVMVTELELLASLCPQLFLLCFVSNKDSFEPYYVNRGFRVF